MARLKSLAPASVGNIFGSLYGTFGLLYLFESVIVDPEKLIYAPLGLNLPYLHFRFDLSVGHSFHGLTALIGPFAYAISGWISGAACAVFYNLLARFGLGFKYDTES